MLLSNHRKSVVAFAWLFIGLIFAVPRSLYAQYEYVDRNNNEVYSPYLVGDNLGFKNPAETRLWQQEFSRRYLASIYGESRINRRFFFDVTPEGYYPLNMPGYPAILLAGTAIQEVQFSNPADLAIRAEAFGNGMIRKDWELGIDFAFRAHVIDRGGFGIPAEFLSRAMFTHHGFVGTYPWRAGFFGGPEVRPLHLPIAGLTFGAFSILAESPTSWTKATAKTSRWSVEDPFSRYSHLEISQGLSLLNRHLFLNLAGMVDSRRVNLSQYEALLGEEAPQRRYNDLAIEGGILCVFPHQVRLSAGGKWVPYHTTDSNLVRWYRPVWPEVSSALSWKFAVFQLTAGYTFSLIPPHPGDFDEETYPDTGIGFIPESAPGHLFSITLGLKI